MLYGIANSAPTKQAANRQSLNSVVAAFEGQVLPVADCFELYATEKVRLRQQGRPLEDFDLLIGCTALAHGLTLVTRNTRHFTPLATLKLENWIDQPYPPDVPGRLPRRGQLRLLALYRAG